MKASAAVSAADAAAQTTNAKSHWCDAVTCDVNTVLQASQVSYGNCVVAVTAAGPLSTEMNASTNV